MEKNNHLRTWIEIDTAALAANFRQLRNIVSAKKKIMAVVKSNAYGHGIVGIAKSLRKSAPSIWFGVDSLVEGLRLREEGIKSPILVLGSTLPTLFIEAGRQKIFITISNFEGLDALSKLKVRPEIHLKIDTGMHRQGFLPKEVGVVIKRLKKNKIVPRGIYTHFASAKDRAYPTATLEQFELFKKVTRGFERAGFKGMVCHAAASGGALLFPEAHLDMVRIGMALWGHWPSDEAKINVLSGRFNLPKISLKPVLSWKTRVAEVKKIPTGALVGYDLTERVARLSQIAVLPVGYWHGFDRGLSSSGLVLVGGKRAKVLGRVSMDMIVCDVTNIPGVKVGDVVILIGRQGKEEISAEEIARTLNTSPYEVLTRINPLIERIYK
ncbi:MAG: alanine racemase [bacterium]|nr:alanine racemase [bacterium]